jgi:hypothetical protein
VRSDVHRVAAERCCGAVDDCLRVRGRRERECRGRDGERS